MDQIDTLQKSDDTGVSNGQSRQRILRKEVIDYLFEKRECKGMFLQVTTLWNWCSMMERKECITIHSPDMM